MMETQVHIKSLFQYLQPEVLLAGIIGEDKRWTLGAQGIPFQVNSVLPSMDCYVHGARAAFPHWSDDELRQFYWDLSDYLHSQPAGGVLSLLSDYAWQLLCLHDGEPCCRLERLLEWRELSLDLGQDLLVCAGLAQRDVDNNCIHSDFCWPIAIQTNDLELKNILKQGLAENHFHLGGSTQGFPLTWGFLMNHPERAGYYFSQTAFYDVLHPGGGWGTRDNAMPWKKRIYYAAWLRAYLFTLLQPENKLMEDQSDRKNLKERSLQAFHYAIDQVSVVCKMVGTVRFLYGTKLYQQGGRRACLDYAIPSQVDQSRPTRFLSGERRFLYDCFRQCYNGHFSRDHQDMFYLYLLLKQSFRGEVIQTNRRYGFRNFSSYTHRKDQVWWQRGDYSFEANHLAINATLEQPITSLEMRIVPGKNRHQLYTRIDQPDRVSQFCLDEWLKNPEQLRKQIMEQSKTFYVLHFTKPPLPRLTKPPSKGFLELRHRKYRSQVERQAKMVAASLESSSYLCARIRGIDAASHEIGCRPEIFATAFRFLRHFPVRSYLGELQERYWPTLGASYHVGEDFLDITDGLRAIDEAVCFLNLERGDRLGHALALGIEPKEYYQLKGHSVILPAQDLLDNLVWLLSRSLEWGISIPIDLRHRMELQAEELLRKLYGTCCPGATIQEYYRSWMLRGDSPELYFLYDSTKEAFSRQLQMMRYSPSRYDTFRINDHIWTGFDIENYRSNENVRRLVYAYQYNTAARWEGQKSTSYQVKTDYIYLIHEMQECMMRRLMSYGIYIECNPSSNYLIGTFRRYNKHPIFRFNCYNLELPNLGHNDAQMQVSINTDDQSVFDTSLEYEYALLYCGMGYWLDEHGMRQISSDAADRYLEHIRTMGISMVFAKATEQLRNRFLQ